MSHFKNFLATVLALVQDSAESLSAHVILAPDIGLKAAKRPMEPGCTYRARGPRAGRQSVPDIASEMALPN